MWHCDIFLLKSWDLSFFFSFLFIHYCYYNSNPSALKPNFFAVESLTCIQPLLYCSREEHIPKKSSTCCGQKQNVGTIGDLLTKLRGIQEGNGMIGIKRKEKRPKERADTTIHHRIAESLMLEKTTETIQSYCPPIAAMPTYTTHLCHLSVLLFTASFYLFL